MNSASLVPIESPPGRTRPARPQQRRSRIADTALGTTHSLELTVQGFKERTGRIEQGIAAARKRTGNLKEELARRLTRTERYQLLSRRQSEIAEQLDLTKNQAPSTSDSKMVGTQKTSELNETDAVSHSNKKTKQPAKQGRGVRV